MSLSVLAYNIHFGQKLVLIQDWILSSTDKFDLICFQEFPFEKKSKFLKIFEEHGYGYAFAPSFIRKNKQHGELTLYKKDKIKIIDFKVISLGTNLLEKRFYKKNGEKSALLTLIQHNNKKIILANSHLFSFALNSHRIKQLIKILSEIKAISNEKDLPSIVLGDFNYTSIIRQKKLIDFMKSHKFVNAYKTHTHKLFFLGQQLDYVFYNNCAIKKIVIDRIKYSDHYPVQFKIEL